ncbi:hypothetical protein [Acetobacterium wieringae]|nr:hypothetical protein [Acetobacterium wieringae]URN85404.1 hypothetical protein CHL1_001045 [Acetobacterium wieringae]
MFLSEKYFNAKKYEEALNNYKNTLRMQEHYTDIEINFLEGKIHEIERPIAYLYYYKNDEKLAIEYYIKALKRKKDYLPALRELIKLTENNDTVETIATFNDLYDRNNLEEMRLLVEELTKQRSGKLLAYYVAHMNSQFGHQDFSMVIMLLANKKYEQAYRQFYEAYKINYENTYARLAVVAALLMNDKVALLNLANLVKPSFKRIIEALVLGNDEVYLYKEDLKDFFDIFSELIKLKEDNYFDCLINLKDNFVDEILGIETAIGNIFKDEGNYDKAVEMYMESIRICQANEQQKKELKSLYFMIGYCYYKCKSMQKALDYFDVAIETGYLENDIREFVTWIIDQTEDGKLKGHAQKLIDQFDNDKLHVLE